MGLAVVFHQATLLFLLFMIGKAERKQLCGCLVSPHLDSLDAIVKSDTC
jgi:hypothetical protein